MPLNLPPPDDDDELPPWLGERYRDITHDIQFQEQDPCPAQPE